MLAHSYDWIRFKNDNFETYACVMCYEKDGESRINMLNVRNG